jgi:hypothetical protein
MVAERYETVFIGLVFLLMSCYHATSQQFEYFESASVVNTTSGRFALKQSTITEHRSWIGDTLSSLGNKTLQDITLVGTHDSGAFELGKNLMPDAAPANLAKLITSTESIGIPVDWIITPWALAQDRNAYDQMVAGVRYFDVRCGWNGTGWYVFHMEVGNTVELVLKQIRSFLDDNPSEVVVVEVSHLDGPHSTGDVSEIEHHILTIFDGLLLPETGGFIPIRDMVSSNKRAFVSFSAPTSSSLIWSGDSIINSYADSDEIDVMVQYNHAELEKYSNGFFPNKLYKLSWTLTPAADCILLGLLPGFPHSLQQLADTAVPALDTFLANAVNSAKRPGNILILDHFERFALGSNVVEYAKQMNTLF